MTIDWFLFCHKNVNFLTMSEVCNGLSDNVTKEARQHLFSHQKLMWWTHQTFLTCEQLAISLLNSSGISLAKKTKVYLSQIRRLAKVSAL